MEVYWINNKTIDGLPNVSMITKFVLCYFSYFYSLIWQKARERRLKEDQRTICRRERCCSSWGLVILDCCVHVRFQEMSQFRWFLKIHHFRNSSCFAIVHYFFPIDHWLEITIRSGFFPVLCSSVKDDDLSPSDWVEDLRKELRPTQWLPESDYRNVTMWVRDSSERWKMWKQRTKVTVASERFKQSSRI